MKKNLASRFVATAAMAAALAAAPSIKLSLDWRALAQTANSYITPQKPLMASVIITSSANATVLNCSTNPCINGAIVESIIAVGSSVAHTLLFYMCTAACPAASNLIGTFSLPAFTGSSVNTPPVNILSNPAFLGNALPHNNNGNTYLNVPSGSFITVSDNTPASGSNPLNLTVIGGAY